MKMIVSQVFDNGDETSREVYGEPYYLVPSTEQTDMLSVDQVVKISNEKFIRAMAGYDLSSNHLSVFVKEGEIHIFSAVVKTEGGAPYFAFRLSDGTFTELSFEE